MTGYHVVIEGPFSPLDVSHTEATEIATAITYALDWARDDGDYVPDVRLVVREIEPDPTADRIDEPPIDPGAQRCRGCGDVIERDLCAGCDDRAWVREARKQAHTEGIPPCS